MRILRRGKTGTNEDAEEVTGWTLIVGDVPCDIQPARMASVEQGMYGRTEQERRETYFNTGVDIKPDDGVYVDSNDDDASMVGRRFLVAPGGDWGTKGGVQVELVPTLESLGVA